MAKLMKFGNYCYLARYYNTTNCRVDDKSVLSDMTTKFWDDFAKDCNLYVNLKKLFRAYFFIVIYMFLIKAYTDFKFFYLT